MSSRSTGTRPVTNGLRRSFQPGTRSSRQAASKAAPDRAWLPAAGALSMTTTESSRPAAVAPCFALSAADEAGRAGADDEDVDAVHDYASLAALTSCGTTVSRSPTTPKSA